MNFLSYSHILLPPLPTTQTSSLSLLHQLLLWAINRQFGPSGAAYKLAQRCFTQRHPHQVLSSPEGASAGAPGGPYFLNLSYFFSLSQLALLFNPFLVFLFFVSLRQQIE